MPQSPRPPRCPAAEATVSSSSICVHEAEPAHSVQSPARSLQLEEVDTQALLSLLDASDTSPSCRTVRSSSTCSEQKSSGSSGGLRCSNCARGRTATAAERRNAFRTRRKNEWQTLRRQESELTAALNALRKSMTAASGTLSAWKLIALRQQERRVAAEWQHMRLQAAIDSHAVLINGLQHEIRKRLLRENLADSALMASLSARQTHLEPSDLTLFDAYIEQLDAAYNRIDEVLQVRGPTEVATCKVFNPRRKLDGDTQYMENADVIRVPLGLKQTSELLWRLAFLPYRQLDRQQHDDLRDPENTVAIKFRVRCRRTAGPDIMLQSFFVARRYVEAERAVLVWRNLSEAEGELAGLQSDETGWSMACTTGTEDAATLVHTCVRYVPMCFSGVDAGDTERKVEQFTTLVLDSSQEVDYEVGKLLEGLYLQR